MSSLQAGAAPGLNPSFFFCSNLCTFEGCFLVKSKPPQQNYKHYTGLQNKSRNYKYSSCSSGLKNPISSPFETAGYPSPLAHSQRNFFRPPVPQAAAGCQTKEHGNFSPTADSQGCRGKQLRSILLFCGSPSKKHLAPLLHHCKVKLQGICLELSKFC